MTAEESRHRITEEIVRRALANQFGVRPEEVGVRSFDVSGKRSESMSAVAMVDPAVCKKPVRTTWGANVRVLHPAGSNAGDNYACVMKAVTAVADVEGRPPGHAYHHMAKCFPTSKEWSKFLSEVSGRPPSPAAHRRTPCTLGWLVAHAGPSFPFQSLMFETEIVMYTDIMPKLKRLEPKLNAPATYYASLEEGVMMMENLKKMGYDIIGAQRGVRGASQNVPSTCHH